MRCLLPGTACSSAGKCLGGPLGALWLSGTRHGELHVSLSRVVLLHVGGTREMGDLTVTAPGASTLQSQCTCSPGRSGFGSRVRATGGSSAEHPGSGTASPAQLVPSRALGKEQALVHEQPPSFVQTIMALTALRRAAPLQPVFSAAQAPALPPPTRLSAAPGLTPPCPRRGSMRVLLRSHSQHTWELQRPQPPWAW